MDKNIHKTVEAYVCYIKDQIAAAVGEEMAQVVYGVELKPFVIHTESKPRSKTIVPENERCIAMKAGKTQCTRRKTDSCAYCGTHIKGLPHGIIDKKTDSVPTTKREVRAEDIRGIVYYIDSQNNVYKTEDVMKNVVNPAVIGTWTKQGDEYNLILQSTKN